MKTTTASLVALFIPAALCAQVSGQASASTTARVNGASVAGTTSASANGEFRAPGNFSAVGAAKLDAMYAEAKEHHVPREPMASRVAEGQAKGASEATIIVSTGRVKANLEATHDAMIAAGRMHPSDEECARGASAMERGVTKVQIEAIAKSTQDDRSLVVAFDVLGKLAAGGTPVNQAVAQVQANVSNGASDATLLTLTTNGSTAGAAGSANAAAGATAAGTATAAAKPVGGTLTTTVGGVIKKP